VALTGPPWTGWRAAIDVLIRHAPHRPGRGAAGEQPEAMPSPDPAPLEPADASPPPDEVLDLLYRSGEPRDLGATMRRWYDQAPMAVGVSQSIRASGSGGYADLLDTMARGVHVARTDARLRVSGPDRYRLDHYSPRPGRGAPTTIACDGERRWRVYQDRTMVGPAAPLKDPIASLADSCWLLRTRLSGGAELTYRGRRARQLRVTRVPGGEDWVAGGLILLLRLPGRRPGRRRDRRRDRRRRDRLPAPPDLLRRRRARDLVGAGRHQHRARRPGRVPGARPARHPHRRGIRQPAHRRIRGHARPDRDRGPRRRRGPRPSTAPPAPSPPARTFLDDLRGRSHPPP